MIQVRRKNQNLELVSKLMDSVCAKYDCSVTYHSESDTIHFHGDETFKAHVAEETMNLFRRTEMR
ncbi:MAG: hypothetical protein ACLFRG_13330 [Desulfococcaceae bacterium]